MDLEHLQMRIQEETDISRLLGEDYQITTPNKTSNRGLRRVVARSGKKSKKMVLNLMEHKNDDIGIMKIEFIIDKDNRGEWIDDRDKWMAKQIGEEMKNLPFVFRERKNKLDVHDGEEAVYVAEYAIDKNWVKN